MQTVTHRLNTHNAGGEQHCANTGLERSCTKSNNNPNCYASTGSDLNLNNRDALIMTANNNNIKYFFQVLAKKEILKMF